MSEDRLSGSRPTVVVVELSMEWQLADAARWRAGVDLSAAEFELVVELHTDHRFETAPHRLWEAFEAPDPVRFPALRLAREALQAGGGAPTILNAANEEGHTSPSGLL